MESTTPVPPNASPPATIAADVIWIPDEGEVRLYDAKSGQFRTLNATAAEIWLLLAEGYSFDELTTEMIRRHADGDSVKRVVVERDVRAFLETLHTLGLLA
ncbi:PqqD family protein [Streptomyces sp. MNP-20]|uniref:PqqD family protein n=1 Tax=Streptomyces sp. MNP-20 TaxID=2721165 RepID=UPI001557A627|nr:PqqD family protein [Streptomyces sp. MNP-20]